jgi:hypothetical protein
MTELAPVVFLLDVDNTLLDSDQIILSPVRARGYASGRLR